MYVFWVTCVNYATLIPVGGVFQSHKMLYIYVLLLVCAQVCRSHLPLGSSPSSRRHRTVGAGSPWTSHRKSTVSSSITTWFTGLRTNTGRSAGRHHVSDECSLKSSMLLHKTSGTHRRPPALQDRCPFLPPYSCPHKHTCQHHFFWCERSLVCPHGPENNTVIVSILYPVTEKGLRLKYPCTCPFLFHNNSICFLNPESPTDTICIRLLAAHTHSDDDGCSLCATMWCHLICFLEMLCL